MIEENIKNLSHYYRDFFMQDIDEEVFLIERKASNPINLTPFSRQGGHNKQAAPFPREKYGGISFTNSNSSNSSSSSFKSNGDRGIGGYSSSSTKSQLHRTSAITAISSTTFTSQRFLNYGTDDINENANTAKMTTPVIHHSKKNSAHEQIMSDLASPFQSMKSGMRGAATPITNAMEMYNWLHSRKNIISCSNGTIALELNRKVENLDEWLQQQIRGIIEFEKQETAAQLGKADYQIEARTIESRVAQISSLFYRVLHEYYSEEKKINVSIQKCVLACACESVYFILNIKTITFERLVEFISVSWFELWKIIDFFMKLDQTMPVSLKAHILDLEAKVISYYAWREDSTLLRFVRTYITDAENAKSLLDDRQEGYSIEKFFRRLMHQCAYTINQVCSSVRLSDTISEAVWKLMKHILGNASEMLIARHIDQLVLCSVYVMCKIFKSDTQFRSILNKYEELNSHNKSMMRELIYDLPITPDKRDNIVEFYNACFLHQVKKAALYIGKSLSSPPKQQAGAVQQTASTSSSPQSAKNPALTTQMFTSPLKAMFSSDVTKSIAKLPSHMTPQTQMLYAYTESPFLKDSQQFLSQNLMNSNNSGSNNALRSLNSKKMINFDDHHKPVVVNTQQGSSSATNANRLADKISFAKYLKPKMDSIAESHSEASASNFIQNKFAKRVTEGAINNIKTEPTIEESSSIHDSSKINNTLSTPRAAGSITEDATANTNGLDESTTSSHSNHVPESFFKGFSKQSTYSSNNYRMQSPAVVGKSQLQQQRLNLLTPSSSHLQQQQLLLHPLTQIPLQKINSWQNQSSSSIQSAKPQQSEVSQTVLNQQAQQRPVMNALDNSRRKLGI